MAQWKPEDEAQFQELLRRAGEQARELSRLAQEPSPPPPPQAPPAGPARREAAAPSATAGGGGSGGRGFLAGLAGTDSVTWLILALILFLQRQRADRELIWALIYILLF